MEMKDPLSVPTESSGNSSRGLSTIGSVRQFSGEKRCSLVGRKPLLFSGQDDCVSQTSCVDSMRQAHLQGDLFPSGGSAWTCRMTLGRTSLLSDGGGSIFTVRRLGSSIS